MATTSSMSLTSTSCFLPSPSTPSRQVRFRLKWFNALGHCNGSVIVCDFVVLENMGLACTECQD